MGGGTEAFPELGRHCEKSDCNQLDFLPFTCDACNKDFCLEHRSGKSHDCPKSDAGSRKVVVCETCSIAIETTGFGGDDEKKILERHEKSGSCDPRRKKKSICPVRRCKEVLAFSNTATCKTCRVKICLKHRFPADHACQHLRSSPSAPSPSPARAAANKFLGAFSARNGKDCGNKIGINSSSSSVEAC